MAGAAAHLAYKKEVMGKGRKRKLKPHELAEGGGSGGVEAGAGPVFVWKRERKK